MNLEHLDCLFGCDKTLLDFILLEVDAADHLVPRSRKQCVVLCTDQSAGDRVGEFENGLTDASLIIPLPHRAVVRRRHQVVRLRSNDRIDTVCVSNQRADEPVVVLSLRRKAADEPVLVTGVDLLVHEAEADDESIVALPLHRAWSVQDLLSWVRHDLHLLVLILEQLMVERPGHIDLL